MNAKPHAVFAVLEIHEELEDAGIKLVGSGDIYLAATENLFVRDGSCLVTQTELWKAH